MIISRARLLHLCLAISLPLWFHLLLVGLAHIFPHTITERSAHTLDQYAGLAGAALTLLVWWYVPMRRWIRFASGPVILIGVILPDLWWGFMPHHHHCWQPGNYLEAPIDYGGMGMPACE
ncbi:hypothetical protein KSF73_07165 [Burkholderiaceae bacterium DAT-1]|nr:hypothetical protein [Burkholderiaceae bacterium DAT-1]